MKNWFLLGTGFFAGVIVGAVFATYFLLDDMSGTAASRRPASVAAKPVSPGVRKALTAKLPLVPSALPANTASQSQPGDRPVAVQAQAVDIGSVSASGETTVVANAPAERPNVDSAP
jgi:hypothetical protein